LIAPPAAVHRVITDRLAPKKDIDQLRKGGMEITQVDAGERRVAPEIRKRPPQKPGK
jgi:biotin operon repressor